MSIKIKYYICFFFIVPIYLTSTANSQTSLFEDGSGEGAFKIRNNNILINAQQKAIKLNFSNTRETSPQTLWFKNIENFDKDLDGIKITREAFSIDSLPRPVTYQDPNESFKEDSTVYLIILENKIPDEFGVNVNAVANSGISRLFDEGKLDPTGEITAYYVSYGKNETSIVDYDYLVFSVGVKFESVSLIDTTNFSSGIIAESAIGGSLEIAYNTVITDKTIKGIGVSLDIGDNVGEISSKKYTITEQIENNANQSITSVSSLSGILESEYIERRYVLNVNADMGKYPEWNDRLLIAAHIRAKSIEFEKLVPNLGGGIYITNKNDATSILGGVNFIFKDTFGLETNGPMHDRLSINLVTGFKF